MYLGEIMGSITMAGFMIWAMYCNNEIIGSSNNGMCEEELGFSTYFVTSLILIKTVLSAIVTLRMFT